MEPLVEIIIINYNGYEDTVECIKSLKTIKYNNAVIVVIDNGSIFENHEIEISYIKDNAIYILSENNLGFAGGNNYAIEATKYLNPDYYLLLNNDTIVTEDFLNILVTQAERNADAGIICGKINYYYDKEYLWFAGGLYNPKTCSTRHIGINKLDEDKSDRVDEIEFATGCLWLLPRNVVEVIGLFDEGLFLYAEDTDYCRRVRNHGYKILYCNKALIYHKVSRSSGKDSTNTQYYITRNELYIIKKYSKAKLIAYPVKLFRFTMDVLKKRKSIELVLEAICDFVVGKKGMREI